MVHILLSEVITIQWYNNFLYGTQIPDQKNGYINASVNSYNKVIQCEDKGNPAGQKKQWKQ